MREFGNHTQTGSNVSGWLYGGFCLFLYFTGWSRLVENFSKNWCLCFCCHIMLTAIWKQTLLIGVLTWTCVALVCGALSKNGALLTTLWVLLCLNFFNVNTHTHRHVSVFALMSRDAVFWVLCGFILKLRLYERVIVLNWFCLFFCLVFVLQEDNLNAVLFV